MPIQPSPVPEGYRGLFLGNPIIAFAEQALRAFYCSTRAEAARALPHWRYYGELTERERLAVLDRFDDDDRDPVTHEPLPPGVEGWPL